MENTTADFPIIQPSNFPTILLWDAASLLKKRIQAFT